MSGFDLITWKMTVTVLKYFNVGDKIKITRTTKLQPTRIFFFKIHYDSGGLFEIIVVYATIVINLGTNNWVSPKSFGSCLNLLRSNVKGKVLQSLYALRYFIYDYL